MAGLSGLDLAGPGNDIFRDFAASVIWPFSVSHLPDIFGCEECGG
jgi:hypothetical protein